MMMPKVPTEQALMNGDVIWRIPLNAKPMSSRSEESGTAGLLKAAAESGLLVFSSATEGVILLYPNGGVESHLTVARAHAFADGFRHGYEAATDEIGEAVERIETNVAAAEGEPTPLDAGATGATGEHLGPDGNFPNVDPPPFPRDDA